MIKKLKNRTTILTLYPADIYFFKINIGNTRAICKICSKLATKTPERRN